MLAMYHDVLLKAKPSKVYEAVTTPKGFKAWWTNDCTGKLSLGELFNFYFSDAYDWWAKVVYFEKDRKVVYSMETVSEDWEGTLLSFEIIDEGEAGSILRFEHSGWTTASSHFRRTNYCWAKYFMNLQKYVETDEAIIND